MAKNIFDAPGMSVERSEFENQFAGEGMEQEPEPLTTAEAQEIVEQYPDIGQDDTLSEADQVAATPADLRKMSTTALNPKTFNILGVEGGRLHNQPFFDFLSLDILFSYR